MNFNDRDQRAANEWIGNVVIYKLVKNCYPLVALRFDHSAQTIPVEGLNITHVEYFRDRKKINLEYPYRKCSHLVKALLIYKNITLFIMGFNVACRLRGIDLF